MAELVIKDLGMTYANGKTVLAGLNLTVADGELVSILGPSGCGKTTTLRIIAGLLNQTEGQLLVDGQDLSQMPVHKRQFGMVFQSYALFPHMTVFDNVAFGLRQQHVPVAEVQQRVSDALALVGLDELASRVPKQLSGGQQQRVSLARALVVQPRLLLMDEPLSNLDAKLRVEMREEIRRIQQQLHMTVIFVTHDREECFAISDRVAVMNGGRVEQYDTPQNIYEHPATEFIARFIGFDNFMPVTATNAHTMMSTGVSFQTVAPATGATTATIRPDAIQLVQNNSANANTIAGTIKSSTFLGKTYRYTLSTAVGELKADVESATPLAVGTDVNLYLDPVALLPLAE